MTDLEISRALALAIGWNLRNVILKDLYGTRLAQCWCFTGVQWVEFDYRDWNVIGPIAEKFNAFPSKWNTDSEKVWYAWDMVNRSTHAADTPQRAIAMAVIAAARVWGG